MSKNLLLAMCAGLALLTGDALAQWPSEDTPAPINLMMPQAAMPEWYPADCGHADDCAVVDQISWTTPADGRTGQLVITSAHRTATVKRKFPVLESRDTRLHVCMRFDPFGELEVTCLLIPTQHVL